MGIYAPHVLPKDDLSVYEKESVAAGMPMNNVASVLGLKNYAFAKKCNGLTTLSTRAIALKEKGSPAKKCAKAAYEFFKGSAYCLMSLIWPFPFFKPVARLDPVFDTVDIGVTSYDTATHLDNPRRKKLHHDHTTAIAITQIALTALGATLILATTTPVSAALALVVLGNFFTSEALAQEKLNAKYI